MLEGRGTFPEVPGFSFVTYCFYISFDGSNLRKGVDNAEEMNINTIMGGVVIIYAVVDWMLHAMVTMPNFFHLATLGIVIGGIGLSKKEKWGIYTVIISISIYFFNNLYDLSRRWTPEGILIPDLVFQSIIIFLAVRMLLSEK